MAEYAVWAPLAKTVGLVIGDVHRPVVMQHNTETGWWHAEAAAESGTRYGFSINGGSPVPDPRSCCQPDGVHGLSEVMDHKAYEWHDADWKGFNLHNSVIYEMHVGTFTPEGTLTSAIKKLDYLKDLGVGAIELLPVVEFPGDRGWGYDGVDLYAPHHAYGGPDELKQLVEACHAHGLGVIFDVVYNHLGPDGNYLGQFGPYFTDKHQTPWGQAVNYDGPDSDPVRKFVLDNAEMWLEWYHGDGLRLDAVHQIFDDSPKHIVAAISELAEIISARRGWPAWVTAENDSNNPIMVKALKDGGWGVDAGWNDDFHHALHVQLTGEHQTYYADYVGLPDLVRALQNVFVYTGQHSDFLDKDRGQPATGVVDGQFVVFSQNHDQVGNRAQGERLSMLAEDARLLDVAAAAVILGPFVPLIFMGEEWGAKTPFLFFTDHQNLELAHAVTEGRKREFSQNDVADPQDLATFERSKLNWSEHRSGDSAHLHDWYKFLINLRRTEADFAAGSCAVEKRDDVLIMKRGSHQVFLNFGDQRVAISEDLKLEPYSVHITNK